MDSYIEISWIHNFITIYMSCFIGKYACVQPTSDKKIVGYAMSITTCGCFCWFPKAWCIVVLLEISFFLNYFRHVYKVYIIALCFRYLCYFTSFAVYHGGFHNFLWFVPAQAFIYPLWAFYILLYIVLAMKWKDMLAKVSYVYQVHLYVQDQTLLLKGYLDSGNLLTYQHIPVLFIDKKYQTYFLKQRIELVVRNSIADMDVIRCYECEMAIEGSRKHRVLISCEGKLKLPMKCDILLHMKVITQG